MDGIPAIARFAATRPAKAAATSVIFHPVRTDHAAAIGADLAVLPPAARDARGRDRRAFARAKAILADLSILQAGLLSGEADPVLLRRLADSGPSPADDPGLADLLAHASLRAQVELARRQLAD